MGNVQRVPWLSKLHERWGACLAEGTQTEPAGGPHSVLQQLRGLLCADQLQHSPERCFSGGMKAFMHHAPIYDRIAQGQGSLRTSSWHAAANACARQLEQEDPVA